MKSDTLPPQQEHITSLTGFLKNVMRLAVYAVENGVLPDNIQMDELYRMWETKVVQKEALCDEDILYLQNCYMLLSRQLAPITAISLRATECKQSSISKDYMGTDAGVHVRHMWFASFVALAAIVLMNIYQYMFEQNAAVWATSNPAMFNNGNYLYALFTTLTPFMYGAFGASVFLLRQAETQLRERTFDPRRLPEFRNRLVLGTLSGGVIVLLYSSGGIAETDIKITEAALGFIGGYSIDLLFSLLDRIVNALKPTEKTATYPAIASATAITPPAKRKRSVSSREEKELPPQLKPVTKKESGSDVA
ncbi:MAG TPA: hypothetical protein ENJ13_09770 [Chromatiales bacterium]|nr:hypothetical protein [Chromatiales bacterium]